MDQLNESNPLTPSNINNKQTINQDEARDQNIVNGMVEKGGIVIQGDQPQVEINQYFGNQATSNDLKSPDAAEIIRPEYFEPETILIPEGSFRMGSQPGNGIPECETPQHEVFLSTYRIAKRPVTNAQYAEFVRQTGKLVPRIMGWKGQLVPDGREDDPVLGVTWAEAMEYCGWLSRVTGRKYSLPNEAQWEKPFRGAYGLSEGVGNVLQWTCTLWGEKRAAPDPKYRYPWKDDGRNTTNESSLLRVVRGTGTAGNTDPRTYASRCGQDPKDPGFPDVRHSFRVVMIV
jgi:formylglycine-generating enzyme required for sulfatase activity